MRKLLAYPLTCIYFLFFGLSLLVFHPIQWFCFNVFGYQAHKKSVDYLNFCLTRCLHFLGCSYQFKVPSDLPKNVPVIIVANHQSMNDIPPIIWFMRRFHVKFISKKELGKGLPSVSYNLRHGGSVLIDRKDAKQALSKIKEMAAYIEKNNRSVVIFPEGTRSRDGQPKPFQTRGLTTLIEHAPNAYIFPVTINNSWKTLIYGKFPMGIGYRLKYTVHKPLKISDYDTQTLIETTENTIKNAITFEK
jgi:1-acyl-sn-glycerol-3-phosphate acyltransferase